MYPGPMISDSGCEGVRLRDNPVANLIPDATIVDQRFFLGPRVYRQLRWIVESLVNHPGGARKCGTGLVSVPAYRDDDVQWLIAKIGNRFAPVTRDVDADFGHHLDGERVKAVRYDPGAECLDIVVPQVTAETLGHLAAAGVPGAKKENAALPAHQSSPMAGGGLQFGPCVQRHAGQARIAPTTGIVRYSHM